MKKILLLVGAIAVLGAAAGCSGDDSGLTPQQQKMGQDLDALAKSSGGDWSKLSAAQQQELVQSTGSEATAKSVLQMKAHPPTPIAPGPPPGWKPGSAPSH